MKKKVVQVYPNGTSPKNTYLVIMATSTERKEWLK